MSVDIDRIFGYFGMNGLKIRRVEVLDDDRGVMVWCKGKKSSAFIKDNKSLLEAISYMRKHK